VVQVTSQGRGELLDGDEEKELTLIVQDLLKLEAVAAELKISLGRTPTDQEWMEAVGMTDDRRFAARVHQGRKAKTMMVQSNLRLVVSICKKYTGYGLALQDLIAEGIAGLLKGVEKFEPTKGFKFSTYAHWWIRQSITRGLSDQGRMVRLPVHMHELLQKVMKAQRTLSEMYGRQPRMEEVSQHLGVELERIHEMYEVMKDTNSLDQPIKDSEGGATLGDTVEVRWGGFKGMGGPGCEYGIWIGGAWRRR
jgi:RNA polymerase primary sigma factor